MRLTIRKPDDWHLHLRDGAMLEAVMPFTAKHFGRAILMPNLVPPVMTTKDAVAYRERALAARPPGSTFTPLMTCYLRDDTDPDDVERGFRDGVFTGVKLYPANATTNSAAGVTDLKKAYRVLERMEKIDMPFLMHGEDVDPDVDIFDREAVFIERKLIPLTKSFPGLRMILEHLSSKEGVDFVRSATPQLGGTITPYHLILTRTDWLGHGLKPYMYVMPVIKTARDRDALAQGGDLGGILLFPRHRFRSASGGAQARRQRRSRHVQFAGGDRDLCQGIRGGGRPRQARSLRLHQRRDPLQDAGEHRYHHARKDILGRAGRGQGRRTG